MSKKPKMSKVCKALIARIYLFKVIKVSKILNILIFKEGKQLTYTEAAHLDLSTLPSLYLSVHGVPLNLSFNFYPRVTHLKS